MSWQCPYCETVNQDAVPVCTVCDRLAPVIETYLSLESIQSLRDYNEKLDAAYHFEAIGDFEGMLTSALDAVSIYKENGIAVDKARQAIVYINKNNIISNLTNALETAKEAGDAYRIAAILQLCENLNITNDYFRNAREQEGNNIKVIDTVNKILDDTYNAMVKLDIEQAKQIIDNALLKYPSEKLLIDRAEDIKKLAVAISNIKSLTGNQHRRLPRPKPKEPITPDKECLRQTNSKRKFPTVKRNNK